MRSFLFLHKMPFVRLLLPLLLGIVCGKYLDCPEMVSVLVCVFSSLLCFSFLLSSVRGSYRYDWTFGVSLFLFVASLGAMLAEREVSSFWMPRNGDGVLLLSEVVEVPEEKPSTVKCLVSMSCRDSGGTSDRDCLLLLYVRKDSVSKSLRCGDVLAFPDNLFRESKLNPEEFDYATYLRNKGISGSLYLPAGKWRRVGSLDRFSLKTNAMEVRGFLLSKLSKYGFAEEEFGVLSAMVLGCREYMDVETKESYARTGASHILAVSGLHVGVVFFVFSFILNLFWPPGRWKLFRAVLLLLALWTYAFVTGLPSSVVRSSVMLSFVCIGMSIGRKSSIYNTVAASAFFMLLCRPSYLFDVSFQLSFAAVLSIVFFQPKIYSMVSFSGWLPEKLWSLFSVSLAAQIATLPISLFYFHQFANYFWLSGFVVVPLSAVIIYLAIFLMVLPELSLVGELVSDVLNVVLKVMNVSVRIIESMPFATISDVGFGKMDVLLVFLVIFLFSSYLISRSSRLLYLSMFSLLFYLCYSVCLKYDKSKEEMFAVYNIRNASVLNCFGRGRNYVTSNVPMEKVLPHVSNLWMEKNAVTPECCDKNYFEIGGRRVFCLRDSSFKNKEAGRLLNVDVLVLSGNVDYSVAELNSAFKYGLLVFDSSNSWKYRSRLRKECEVSNVKFYDVVESGAFLMEGNKE